MHTCEPSGEEAHIMQASTDTYTTEIDDLERLAAELTARGLHAAVQTPQGRLPYLDVTNPQASVLTERVFAQADSYWFSWCERITGCDQTAGAADILARVLRTTDPSNPQ
jgi:hypothetical protein